MKKLTNLLSVLLVALFIFALAGCGGRSAPAESAQPVDTSEIVPEIAICPPDSGSYVEIDPLEGLSPDKYPGLKIAVVQPTEPAKPGSKHLLEVTLTNKGDKTVVYTHGSGTFTTPVSLFAKVQGLQCVIPDDQLGIATMDMQYKELKPGETVTYTVVVMAIQNNEAFEGYTYQCYLESERYIADIPWAELQKMYPDLVAAAAGTYEASVYFTYFIQEDGDNPTSDPTGYAEAKIGITVG